MARQPKKPIRRRALTAEQFIARYKAEKSLQRWRYCEVFALWRQCTNRRCRRQRACAGDHAACLKRALAAVPHAAQWQARETILATTAKNIGAPERAARQCMPTDLYVDRNTQAAADYLARFEQKRRTPP